jgi:hypothetical protein
VRIDTQPPGLPERRLIPGEALDPSPPRPPLRRQRQPLPRQARRQPWYHGADLGYVLVWIAAATAMLTVAVLAALRAADAPPALDTVVPPLDTALDPTV